jgi:histone H3/H4
MADLVVKKALKEWAKKFDKRFPDSTVDAVDAMIKDVLTKANKRAESNGRKTITEYDL